MKTIETYIKNKTSGEKFKIRLQYNNKLNEVKFLSSDLGDSTWEGLDILDAFKKLRLNLEKKDFLIMVNGARRNVWASGFLRD